MYSTIHFFRQKRSKRNIVLLILGDVSYILDGKCYFYFLKRSIFVRFVASKNSQLLGYFHFFASNVPRDRAHLKREGRGHHDRYGGFLLYLREGD